METKEREYSLQSELDACKVRLEGFDIAQKQHRQAEGDGSEHAGSKETSVRNRGRFESRKSFFSSSEESSSSSSFAQTGDVATALVVSQKQNEALQAHNEELESANANLQKKCHELTKKYGLNGPEAGDIKGNQLYSRYLEMKSSLSSLSVVLEEVQDKNSKLNERVVELETELSEQNVPEHSVKGAYSDSSNGDQALFEYSFDDGQTLQKTMSAEQEETLKVLVEKLEVQILDYRQAEQRHGIVKTELESTVEKLEKEASTLREQLEESKSQKYSSSTLIPVSSEKLQKELDHCYKQLDSRITKEKSDELRTELESLQSAMDAAADESTHLLNEMERMLASSREELRQERAKFQELEAKFKDLVEATLKNNGYNVDANGSDRDDNSVVAKEALSNSEKLLNENERLNAAILTLQEQTQQLKIDLDKKTIKIERSEQRLSSKHEKSQQLKEVNASLREGIQQLKGHLETISEEATKTENSLTAVKEELNSEREKAQKLEAGNSSLQTELDVLKVSTQRSINETSSENIRLHASLVASEKALLFERELVEKTIEEKRELGALLDTTNEDLQTQLYSEKQSNSKLDAGISILQQESYRLKLIIAVATKRMETMDNSTANEIPKLRNALESTEKLLVAERAKIEELNASKASLKSDVDSMKQNIEELTTCNAALKAQIEATKTKATTEATDSAHQFNQLEKLLATTQEELNDEERRVETLEEQIDMLTMQIDELEKCKGDLQISLDEVKQEVITVNAKRLEFESLLVATQSDLTLQIQTVNMEHASTLVKEAEFTVEISKKDEEIQELTSKLATARSEKEVLEGDVIEKDEITMRSEKLSSELDQKKQEFEELSAKLRSVESSQNELLANFEKISDEKDEIADKSKTLASELIQRSKEIEELTDKLQKLEVVRAEMESQRLNTESMEKEKAKILSTMIVALKEEKESLTGELAQRIKEIEDLTDELQKLECSQAHNLEQLNEKNEALTGELDQRIKEIEELTDELQKLECSQAHNLEQLNEKNEALTGELDQRIKEIEELTDELQKLECSQAHNIEQLDENNKEIEDLTSKLKKFEAAKNKTELQKMGVQSVAEEKAGVLYTMVVLLKEEKESLAASLKAKEESIGKTEALAKLLGEENAELRSSVETLSTEQKNAAEDKASTDVRLWEVEMLLGSTKRELVDALERNEKLTGNASNLESSMEKCQSTNAQTLKESETHARINNENARKIELLEKEIASLNQEKQSLLKRTALLARRDQIQKASLTTANEEIAKLMSTMGSFQGRFESLAEEVEKGQAGKLQQMKEIEDEEAKWIVEKNDLNEHIKMLETELDEIKKKEDALKSKHIPSLESKDSELDFESNPLQTSLTDRSIFNNKLSELEQELQLLEVTLDSTKQERDAANIELDETKVKLDTCEEELKTCRDEMQSLAAKSARDLACVVAKVSQLEGELQTCRDQLGSFKEYIANLESSEQDSEASRQSIQKNSESTLQRMKELQSKHDACLEELKSCRQELERLKTEKIELEATAAVLVERSQENADKNLELQSKHESCLKELKSCREELECLKADNIELEASAAMFVSSQENADRNVEGNKKALTFITDELNEAHVREGALEEMLASCQKELFTCMKKIESMEAEVSEERYGAGVYKDVIGKLNKSNDSLVAKNEQLKQEMKILKAKKSTLASNGDQHQHSTEDSAANIAKENAALSAKNSCYVQENAKLEFQLQQCTKERESLKASAVALQIHVDQLRGEIKIARVVTGRKESSSASSSKEGEFERENLVLKELLGTSQRSVTEAKKLQQQLSKQVEVASKREARLTKEILSVKARNVDMERRLEDQEKELDEFESDFSLARNDARKVVEELRSQLLQLEKRNQQLESEGSGGAAATKTTEGLKNKLRQLIQQNKRLQKEIEYAKVRERRLESQLGLEPRRKNRKG